MTVPPRMPPRWNPSKASGSYASRIRRYHHNAGVTAGYADRDAERLEKSAEMHGAASDNAYKHADEPAADLYEDMEHWAQEAARAMRQMAEAARKLETYFEERLNGNGDDQ